MMCSITLRAPASCWLAKLPPRRKPRRLRSPSRNAVSNRESYKRQHQNSFFPLHSESRRATTHALLASSRRARFLPADIRRRNGGTAPYVAGASKTATAIFERPAHEGAFIFHKAAIVDRRICEIFGVGNATPTQPGA